MNDKRADGTVEGDCADPHVHPVPPGELWRYSPVRDEEAEQEVADYIERTASDETVEHVERVTVEYVMGTPYEVWDVTTDKNRWWVLNNPLHLYSQRHFPSLDYTLSFHIGLMLRLRSRDERPGPSGGSTPFDEVLRRLHQAEDVLDRAVEAIDFQTVGMHLREALIALMIATRRRTELPAETEHPQDSNVVAWSDLLFNHFCPGQSNERLRQYLKATTERTWHLVNWLTHHTNANKTAALIAKHAVEAIVIHMTHLLTREGRDRTDQCPQCGSRALRTFFDIEIEPDGAYFDDCSECDWHNHPGYEGALDDVADLDAVVICEAQLESARSVHEMWMRKGNESMIAFTASSIAAIEEQIIRLREESSG